MYEDRVSAGEEGKLCGWTAGMPAACDGLIAPSCVLRDGHDGERRVYFTAAEMLT